MRRLPTRKVSPKCHQVARRRRLQEVFNKTRPLAIKLASVFFSLAILIMAMPLSEAQAQASPMRVCSKDAAVWEEARCEMGRELSAFTGYENRYYFAEGYSGSGFSTWLCFGNSLSVPVRTRVTYLYNGHTPTERYLTLAALSRTTLYVNSGVGPDREFSMIIESEYPVVCEHPMYFNYQPQ